jgi:excisionase family DNA binding protein
MILGMNRNNSLSESYGELGKAIETHVETVITQKLSERVEPTGVLAEFTGMEVLDINDMSRVLRGATKEKIQDACNRGEIPHIRFGREYLFPKKLVADLLLGAWKPTVKRRK